MVNHMGWKKIQTGITVVKKQIGNAQKDRSHCGISAYLFYRPRERGLQDAWSQPISLTLSTLL
jgi:hypothetical protein